MKRHSGISSQDIGKEYCEKLNEWIARTPLHAIPTNCYGRSAKSTICRLLGITKSTIGTNKAISEAFKGLDDALSGRANANFKSKPTPLDESIGDRLDQPSLLDEIDSLKCEVARLRYFTHTGQWIEE